MLEWRDKWEKVLRDAEIASAEDGVIRFDAEIMTDWKIISAYFKSAVWPPDKCPHGRVEHM